MPPQDPELEARRAAARRGCTRWLLGHGDIAPAAWLAEIAAATSEPDLDRYGEGGEVAALEARGGRAARQGGRRLHAERDHGAAGRAALLGRPRRRPTAVAVHGMSHLVVHELDALPELHGLRLQRLTDEPRPATVADLDALAGPLAAVTLELPLREPGYLLPTWDELVAFSERAHERGVPLHLDGARLWECADALRPVVRRDRRARRLGLRLVLQGTRRAWPVPCSPVRPTSSPRPGAGSTATAATSSCCSRTPSPHATACVAACR